MLLPVGVLGHEVGATVPNIRHDPLDIPPGAPWLFVGHSDPSRSPQEPRGYPWAMLITTIPKVRPDLVGVLSEACGRPKVRSRRLHKIGLGPIDSPGPFQGYH